jgi:rod shape-determining protein MreD
MKIALRLLVIYSFFLIQSAFSKFPIDLVLLFLTILTLYEEPKYAILDGLWAGLLLDILNPIHLGFHLGIFTVIGYLLSNIRRYIYNNRLYFLIIVLLVLHLKYLLSWIILKTPVSYLRWLAFSVLLLVIAVPLDNLFIQFVLRKWRTDQEETLY